MLLFTPEVVLLLLLLLSQGSRLPRCIFCLAVSHLSFLVFCLNLGSTVVLARWRLVFVLSQQRWGTHCPGFGSPFIGQDWKGQSLIAGAASSLSVYICPFLCLHEHFHCLVGPLQLGVHITGATSSWAPEVSFQCNSYCWLCLSFNEEIIPSDIFLISESLWVLETVVCGPLIGEMKNDPPKKGVKLISLFTEHKAVWVDLFIWVEGIGKIGFNFPYLCKFEKCNPSSCLVFTMVSSLPHRNLLQIDGKQTILEACSNSL